MPALAPDSQLPDSSMLPSGYFARIERWPSSRRPVISVMPLPLRSATIRPGLSGSGFQSLAAMESGTPPETVTAAPAAFWMVRPLCSLPIWTVSVWYVPALSTTVAFLPAALATAAAMVLSGAAAVPAALSEPFSASTTMAPAGVGYVGGLKTSISAGVVSPHSCSCSASNSVRKSPRSGSRYLPYSQAAARALQSKVGGTPGGLRRGEGESSAAMAERGKRRRRSSRRERARAAMPERGTRRRRSSRRERRSRRRARSKGKKKTKRTCHH